MRRWADPGRVAAALVVGILIGLATVPTWSTAPERTRTPPAAGRIVVGIVDTGIGPAPLGDAIDWGASRSLVPGEDLDDVVGHGSEMASIVHHVAPDARLAIVKAVDRHGATTDARIADAIDHLRRGGARVILLSLAGAEPLPEARRAIGAAGRSGVVVVAAAGNDGLDLSRSASYPGGYRLSNLVTVAATDGQGALLGTSNRGGPTSAAAPGSATACGPHGESVASTGTSAAAALVAGALAAEEWGRSPVEQLAHLAGGAVTIRDGLPWLRPAGSPTERTSCVS